MGKDNGPDLNRIKATLDEIARSVGMKVVDTPQGSTPVRTDATSETPPAADTADLADRLTVAHAWIRSRDARDREFGADLFFDPAWNMLLDLYVNFRNGTPISVSSLCIAAKVPMTTALRWIAIMERRSLVVREPDPFDRRRLIVQLTKDAVTKMDAVLDRASQAETSLGIGRLRRLN